MSSDSEVSDGSYHNSPKRPKQQEKSSPPVPSTSSSVKQSEVIRINSWRKQTFSESWLLLSEFKGWIAAVPGDKYKAKCLPCKKEPTAGKIELVKHFKTAQHIKS